MFQGGLILWCTNGPKSFVSGSTHVLAEMDRNLWVMPKSIQCVLFTILSYLAAVCH